MIKVGDKVKFLNDVGGGVVTSFINKNMVNVENEDGFEIPYPITQLFNVGAPELNIGGEKAKEEEKPVPFLRSIFSLILLPVSFPVALVHLLDFLILFLFSSRSS